LISGIPEPPALASRKQTSEAAMRTRVMLMRSHCQREEGESPRAAVGHEGNETLSGVMATYMFIK